MMSASAAVNRKPNPGEHMEIPEVNTEAIEAVDWAYGSNRMWAVSDDSFFPCEKTEKILPSGQYVINCSDSKGIYFTRKITNMDNLLVLPDSKAQKVLQSIEHFWNCEKKFKKHGFLWKRGIMLFGPPGGGKCLGKDTPVMMFDGTIKMVQNIQVGEQIMGDDSKPRNILTTCIGQEMLYKIKPMKGDSYIVNESHILSLKLSRKGEYKDAYVDVSVKDYLNQSNWFKTSYKGYRAAIDFPKRSINIDPYWLGVWLGDGHSKRTEITTADHEIDTYCEHYANQLGMKATRYKDSRSKCWGVKIVGKKRGWHLANHLKTMLIDYDLINNKHIPQEYLSNDYETRMQLLSGLIDSDGHVYHDGTMIEYSTKLPQLRDDVLFLARSLGFAAYSKEKYVN